LCKIEYVDRIRNHGYIQQKVKERKEDIPVRPLRFDGGNVGWVFSSVKSFWEEDVRDFVLSPEATHLWWEEC
jgi:hypothetical protein